MTNANVYIEQAIRGIEAERDQKIETIKAEIIRDKVAPQNAEIDTKRDNAIQELQTKLNADISALQERFNIERQAIIDASEKQKADNANMLINIETTSINAEYNTKLAELRKLIEA